MKYSFSIQELNKCFIIISTIVFLYPTTVQGMVTISELDDILTIQNENVAFVYDLRIGQYRAIDRRDDTVCLTNGFTQINDICSSIRDYSHSWAEDDIRDELGVGKTVTITSTARTIPTLLLRVTVYENRDCIIFGVGVVNSLNDTLIVKRLKPLAGGRVFKDYDISRNFSMLDGNGGGEQTAVTHGNHLLCRNNLLVTFGTPGYTRSLVIGGLTYSDFEKFAEAGKPPLTDSFDKQVRDTSTKTPMLLSIQMFGQDPFGKRIDPGKRYIPDDLFYLDFMTDNPFEALETYARCVRDAQKIELNYYFFPTVCLWYSSVYADGGTGTDTPAAVMEMDRVRDSGFLNYCPVAIRLVPDNYMENNQQGWWDDLHWQRLQVYEYRGKTVEAGWYNTPYETTTKWAGAIIERGGIPLTYIQTGKRSQDYAETFPDHMLFNKANTPVLDSDGKRKYYSNSLYDQYSWIGGTMVKYSYDYTDPGFLAHLRDVYENLREGEIRGLMFDYPSTGWASHGGMEDMYSTTASAYRTIFRMAYEGLGPECWLHERNCARGSDVSLGYIASQRVVGDTDLITPELVKRCSLRWYKNRVVVNYDMDGKSLHKTKPGSLDSMRSLLTMVYVASGRLLLAHSFGTLDRNQLHDLSRVVPFHEIPQSARPVDAFSKNFPQVFDFKVNKDWHQVTFYNPDPVFNQVLGVDISGDTAFGALGMDSDQRYYVYDFWNDRFVGIFNGTDRIRQDIRAAESRMISVRRVLNRPQVLSTDRHIMQGLLDLHDVKWRDGDRILSGTADVIGGDPYTIVIACNGFEIELASAEGADCAVQPYKDSEDIIKLCLEGPHNESNVWTVQFKQPATH